MGMGTSKAATHPSSVPDQFTPIASNMYMEKSGKTAPAMERRKVLAAMAEAALSDHQSLDLRNPPRTGKTYNMR